MKIFTDKGPEACWQVFVNDLSVLGCQSRPDIHSDYTRNAAAGEVIVAEPRPGFLRAGADLRQPAYAIVRQDIGQPARMTSAMNCVYALI